METKVVQVRGRGSLTLPARIRERYGISEGDPMTLVDLDGVLLLAPKLSMVKKLAGEIERLREEQGLSVEELIDRP
ncbi:MAG: AbrB/MazE/SpoVT family DNA-binding domain-containing protein [Actinomycetota bacterium]